MDDEGLLLLEPQDRAALPSVPEAVWLGGVHSVAFGHWIIEFLPKLWALMTRQGFGRVPLLVDVRMPVQHLEAVRLVAAADNPVIELQAHQSIRVERLWVSTALHHLPVGPLPRTAVQTRLGLDDAGFRRLMERITPALEAIDRAVAVAPGPPRIHLTRKPSQHRSLVNAHQLQAGLDAAGFVPHDFGDLSFAEQLRLVRGAEWIIGPAGSALENAIFGRPGLRVGVLVPTGPENIDWLGQCCRALGIELTAIVGEVVQPHSHYRWMSGYRVDQELLAAYLGAVPGPEAADGRTGPLRTVAAIRVWADDAVSAPVDVPS
jgi:capsular polysaccharide biosynthesis protein